ncbi:hypothetical protein [Streptomyces sp. NPDC023838]|uniref:hypothetical protein n=1 Tax=Streptomyces sp. NPDC023838 TaxID=3154325 RepID=UPI0033C97045
MTRIDWQRIATDVEYWEKVAAPRAEEGAADGERVAADPAYSDYTRACAGRAAEIARENAAEYRAIAATLRAGEIPDGYRFDDEG